MPKINPHIFRAYDIRGIAMPKNKKEEIDLTEETSRIIGKATGRYFIENFKQSGSPRIIVGRDNRITGKSLQQAFIKGLIETGCRVINAGLTTSPMIYWAVCALPYDGGINITASHNPKEYNGIKIVAKGAHSICGEELQKILRLAQKDENNELNALKVKPQKEEPFAENYITDLLHRATLGRPLKVVIDAGNATTGAFAPELFKKFGCKVIPLYCDLDGNYPHHEANPEEEKNMRDLSAKVIETASDLGIAFDGDGDRIGIIDEKGRHHSADYLLLILAKDLLKRMEGEKIVFDVKVSQIVIDGIRAAKGIPEMCKTGHSFIEARMREIHSPLGGEISGHFFFAENYYGFDDAFLAALRLLEIFSASEKPVSAHFDELPKMFTTPEYKLPCPDDKKFKIVENITKEMTQHYPCITIDGVRVNFDTSSWGAIRCSNTSPNLTARFEAPTQERLKKVKNSFIEELKKYPEVNISGMIEA